MLSSRNIHPKIKEYMCMCLYNVCIIEFPFAIIAASA